MCFCSLYDGISVSIRIAVLAEMLTCIIRTYVSRDEASTFFSVSWNIWKDQILSYRRFKYLPTHTAGTVSTCLFQFF